MVRSRQRQHQTQNGRQRFRRKSFLPASLCKEIQVTLEQLGFKLHGSTFIKTCWPSIFSGWHSHPQIRNFHPQWVESAHAKPVHREGGLWAVNMRRCWCPGLLKPMPRLSPRVDCTSKALFNKQCVIQSLDDPQRVVPKNMGTD